MARFVVKNMWFSDSHLEGHHLVPKYFYRHLQNRSDLSRYNGPIFGKTEGGRWMDDDFVRDVIRGSRQNEDKQALFIIQAGSNNLRKTKKTSSTWKPC